MTLLLDITAFLSQNDPMIVAGTSPLLHIDLGKDEPGMTLQRPYQEQGYFIWREVVRDDEVVKSPVDINKLPAGRYRLV